MLLSQVCILFSDKKNKEDYKEDDRVMNNKKLNEGNYENNVIEGPKISRETHFQHN